MASSTSAKSIAAEAAYQSRLSAMSGGAPTPITTQNAAISKSAGPTVERNADGSTYMNNYVSTNPADAPSAGSRRPSEVPGTGALIPSAVGPTQPIDPTKPAPNPVVPPQVANNLSTPSGMPGMPNLQGSQAEQAGQAIDQLKQKYGTALSTLNQSGVAAPSNQGAGASGVTTALNGQPGATPEAPSLLGGVMETDSNFDSIFTMYDEFMSPATQKKSLLEEYKAMESSLGIGAMNEELIDAKRIIEGTEDDIRSEVTAAGGMATDSQVLAMSNARNKSLIKNYNYLLESRDNARTQLSTMMQYSIQDRQFAEAEFDRKMSFAFKVAEFKQKATDNARSTYMTLGQQMGWDTLLSSVTPYEQGVIGRTIGLDANGLNNLALRSQEDRQMALQENQLDMDVKKGQLAVQASNLETDKAQRANIYSQIEQRNYEMNPASGVDEKTMAKIQASPEYKTINGVLPAMAAVQTYLKAVKDTGSFEFLNGAKAGELKASYGNAIAAWKTLAALGALSGADFGLAENVIPAPSFFTRNSKVEAQLMSAADNGLAQAEIMTKRLSQNYPTAAPLLNQQLDDMRVTAHPEQYTYGDDGLVYKVK